MEFKGPYLEAMRTQAPRLFNQLRRSGALDAHLQKKTAEAYRMLDEMLADEPKYPDGMPKNPARLREAEEQVRATLIEFPTESRADPNDPLAPLNG